ncbi:MAG: amino acid permease [Bdellovibrionales bacterium]|nr:amino acid permease [Bdellovibrionales bacterium]
MSLDPGGGQGKSGLVRSIGLGGALLIGLSAMVGSGVYVSLGLATGLAGPSVLWALAAAAVLALLNGLSVAQLSADLPLSGGTYEFGYRHLHPWAGFSAGWLFLCAKSASAATAALGAAGYALQLAGAAGAARFEGATVPLALVFVAAITVLAALGMRRSNKVTLAMILVAVGALVAFVALGLPGALAAWGRQFPGESLPLPTTLRERAGFLEAVALLFVSYAGFARLATLGEEVSEPRRTIPRALLLTLAIVFVIYAAVAVTALGQVGPAAYADLTTRTGAPLERIAERMGHPWLGKLLGFGAVAALLGVLLNLVLGLSRVAFAMGRRGDLPRPFAKLESVHRAPFVATLCSGGLIALLVLPGNIEVAWSFSAFTVLVYYAITNAAALRLPRARRMFPPLFAALGLVGCLSLAFWVEALVWAVGLGILALGVAWRVYWRRHALKLYSRHGTQPPV